MADHTVEEGEPTAHNRVVLEAAFHNDPNTRELCEHNGLNEAKFLKLASTIERQE